MTERLSQALSISIKHHDHSDLPAVCSSQRGTTRMVQACQLSQKHFSNAGLAQLFCFFGLFLGYIRHFPKGLCWHKRSSWSGLSASRRALTLVLWTTAELPVCGWVLLLEELQKKWMNQLLCSQSNRCKRCHMLMRHKQLTVWSRRGLSGSKSSRKRRFLKLIGMQQTFSLPVLIQIPRYTNTEYESSTSALKIWIPHCVELEPRDCNGTKISACHDWALNFIMTPIKNLYFMWIRYVTPDTQSAQ